MVSLFFAVWYALWRMCRVLAVGLVVKCRPTIPHELQEPNASIVCVQETLLMF
jgi:hypothetical protein